MVGNDLKFLNLCSNPFFSGWKIFKLWLESRHPIYEYDPCLPSDFQCSDAIRLSISAMDLIQTQLITSFIVDSSRSARFGVVDVEPEAVCHGADSVLHGIAALDF